MTNRWGTTPGPDYRQCAGHIKPVRCRRGASTGSDYCPQHKEQGMKRKALKDMTYDELTSWVCDYFSEPEALEAVELAYMHGRLEGQCKKCQPFGANPHSSGDLFE